MSEIKEIVLHWLEKEESAFDKLDDIWRDKIDTTGATTVRELFERYEKDQGPLSTDDLKDLLTELAFVNITCHVFPQMGSTSSTGLPFGNSVTRDLEVSSFEAGAAGAQLPLSGVMVVGLDRLREKLPSKPSSHDWYPEKTSASGTMQELLQNLSKENNELKIKVRRLEGALERERGEKLQSQSRANHFQQRVEQVTEGYDEKVQELTHLRWENELLVDRERKQQEQLELERSSREQDRAEFQRQLQRDREEFQQQVQRDREEFQQQLQRDREEFRQLQRDREEFQRQLQRDREEFQQQLQRDREEFQQLQQQTRNEFREHLQHVERVAEEHCYARHQQPETRTWIIQRDDVVPSNNVLGTGSWGVVRQGTFRGSPVAIKELHSVILSPHNRRLFEREMEILSRCRHPNIVQFMGATSDDQHPLFVTELLDRNLRELLEERTLIREEIVSLALDVARGLNNIHHNQPPIAHRDVKSDNVLLKRGDNSWIAKVSDFGAANFCRRVMTPNQGTPLYSAPESSTAQHSELVDVYSFGLLLLEMCIREYPVPDQLADQIKHVPCPRLKELIRCCVQQVPERRPGMNEVIEFLTQLME